MTEIIWATAIEALPDGRYQGVSYVSTGNDSRGAGPLPRGADVRYRTRPTRDRIEAAEQARHRTIHHNLWHDGAGFTAGHRKADCHPSEAA